MIGMNAATGNVITGLDHLRQSVRDILTTPIGSRIMRRDYGSEVPELIDQPDNGVTRVRLYAATVMALMQWEPRLKISRVQLNTDNVAEPGLCILDIYGSTTTSAELSIQVPFGAST